MSVRGVAVNCADHGPMTRDEPRMTWACATVGCEARIPDAEVYRIVAATPGDGPVPIAVVPDWALDTS